MYIIPTLYGEIDDVAFCVEANAEVFVGLFRRQLGSASQFGQPKKEQDVSLAELLDLMDEDSADMSTGEPVIIIIIISVG
jgi:hypothetical protein